MSTTVGTMQASRTGGSILLAAFLASFVMLTITLVAISLDQGRQGETTFVGRHLVNLPSEVNAPSEVNTPSELGAQIGGGRPKTVAGGTLTTPTELSGGIRHKFVSDTLGTNTPTELSSKRG